MEKIKQKPIEKIKTLLIALLTLAMLVLASLYIGGIRFSSSSSALTAKDLPRGSVALGEDIPTFASVYEKELLTVSFVGIRYEDLGGGAYGTEAAAQDLLDFVAEPIHSLLSYPSAITEVSYASLERAIEGNKYICISLVSPLPYQIIYALSGEYVSPASHSEAISPRNLLVSFDGHGTAMLYMYSESHCYEVSGSFTLRPSELSAMANDSRLYPFEIVDGLPISDGAPLVQTVSASFASLGEGETREVFELFGYDEPTLAKASSYSAVAPHGTLQIEPGRLLYTASNEGGILISAYLEEAKSELDIDMYDVLLSSVSLVENIRKTLPEATAKELDIYLEGFYRSEDIYTVVFGYKNGNIPVKGSGLEHFARLTVKGGRIKELDISLITAENSGYTYSPFPSAWEYRYASKNARVYSIALKYNIVSLPCDGLGAAWYYTGERTVVK